MKIYALLLCTFSCVFSQENQVPEPPPPPRSVRWPGTYPVPHAAVVAAHEQKRKEEEERNTIVCCCCFKIKKRI